MSDKLKVFVKNDEKAPNTTFFGALFSRSTWYPKLTKMPLTGQMRRSPVVIPDLAEPIVEEVEQVSVVEKTAPKQVKQQVIKSDVHISSDLETALKSIESKWKVSDIAGIEHFNTSVKVLFYGLDEIAHNELPEHPPISLISSDQDLLGKMIRAMGLEQGHFVRVPMLMTESPLNNLADTVAFFRPQVLITLGAKATNTALEKRVKLSSVHGEIIKKSFPTADGEITVDICALFHPQFLEINPSMKRTAWLDMKNVMDLL